MDKLLSGDSSLKIFKITILQWSLIGLLLRFLLMPFTMHTVDLLFIYYFPFQGLTHGVMDIYRFVRQHFPFLNLTYYPPLTYFLMMGILFFLKSLLPQLASALRLFESWFFTHGGGTVHYASFLGDFQIFRTLFLLKLPYLVFDFATGLLLIRLARNSKEALCSYRLWMLNPLVLYSVYAIGQMEVIPIFFTVLALYWGSGQKKSLAMMSLSLGALVKVYPLLFIPLAAISLGKDWKDRLRLFAISLLPWIIFFVPLYFSSKGAVMDSIFISALKNVTGGALRKGLFLGGYLYLLFYTYRARNEKGISLGLGRLILLVFLLFILVCLTKFRYVSWLSPFLILAVSRDRKLGWLSLVLLLLMAEIHLSGNQAQWGLLAPLAPTFFSSLPILDSFFLACSLSLPLIHKVSYLLFLAVTAITLYRVWKWQGSY